MARKQTIDAILSLFQKLGGNTSDVLGTKTNVNFLGKGKSPELMLDMDINQEALAVLPQSKAVEELTSSVGYAVSGKLNDIQANQLLKVRRRKKIQRDQQLKERNIQAQAQANMQTNERKREQTNE